MTDLFSYIVSPALNRSTCCEELPQRSSSPYGKHIGGYKEPRRQPKGLPLDQSMTLRKMRAVYGDNTTNQRRIIGKSHERKSHQNLNPNQSPGPSYCEVHAGLQRNLIQVSLLACSLITVMYMFFAMMFLLGFRLTLLLFCMLVLIPYGVKDLVLNHWLEISAVDWGETF